MHPAIIIATDNSYLVLMVTTSQQSFQCKSKDICHSPVLTPAIFKDRELRPGLLGKDYGGITEEDYVGTGVPLLWRTWPRTDRMLESHADANSGITMAEHKPRYVIGQSLGHFT